MSTPGVGGVTGAASDSPHADLRLLDAVYEMAAAVAEASSLEDVYDEVLDALVHTVGADRAAVLLLDAGGTLRCEASAGLPEVFRRAVEGVPPWPLDASGASGASGGGRELAPVLISDIEREPGLKSLLPDIGTTLQIAAPERSGGASEGAGGAQVRAL